MGQLGIIEAIKKTVKQGVQYLESQISLGGSQRKTVSIMLPPGEDSQPLPKDYAAIIETGKSGQSVALGFIDSKNPIMAAPGEKIFYARNGSGSVVCSIKLKSDGTIILNSEEITLNGARITQDGDVITADGISLRNHIHNQGNDGGGNIEVPTDPPL